MRLSIGPIGVAVVSRAAAVWLVLQGSEPAWPQAASAASAAASAAAGPAKAQGNGVPDMPTSPSTANLESRRPKCPEYRVTRTNKHLMEQCRALWEDYLRIEIEGYRRSFAPYVNALKRLERKFQLQVPKDLSQALYEEYRSVIAEEIADATVANGRYLATYREYVDSYRRQVKLLQDHHREASR